MNLPTALRAAVLAGKNIEIRDIRMSQAREASNAKQREYFVEIARHHQRIALQMLATARARMRTVELFGAEVRS